MGSCTYIPSRYLAKEIKWLAHSHTGSLWQSQELKPTFKWLNHKIIILPCIKLLILMLVRKPEAQDGCLLIGARHINMHTDLCIHIFKTGWKTYLVSHFGSYFSHSPPGLHRVEDALENDQFSPIYGAFAYGSIHAVGFIRSWEGWFHHISSQSISDLDIVVTHSGPGLFPPLSQCRNSVFSSNWV